MEWGWPNTISDEERRGARPTALLHLRMTGKVEEKEKGSRGRRGDHDVVALTSPLPPLPLPLLPLRIKSGAIKCKSGQTAPPQLVGEFVLKWK